MPDVVDEQEGTDGDPATAQRDGRERQAREQWQPPCPDEAVAERPERPAQRFAHALDLVGRGPVVLGAGGGADREADEVRMGVEEVCAPRHRGTVLAITQIAQQWLFRDADAHAEQALVIVRALHGEQP